MLLLFLIVLKYYWILLLFLFSIFKENKLEIGRSIKKLVDQINEKQNIEIKLKDYNKNYNEIEPEVERYTILKDKEKLDYFSKQVNIWLNPFP